MVFLNFQKGVTKKNFVTPFFKYIIERTLSALTFFISFLSLKSCGGGHTKKLKINNNMVYILVSTKSILMRLNFTKIWPNSFYFLENMLCFKEEGEEWLLEAQLIRNWLKWIYFLGSHFQREREIKRISFKKFTQFMKLPQVLWAEASLTVFNQTIKKVSSHLRRQLYSKTFADALGL